MSEIIQIGQMDNTKDHTFESANRVYDSDGIAPTLPTCAGGGIQPKVLECKIIGGFGEKKSNGGTQWYQQDRVYEMGDVSMCLPSQLPGGSYNYIECKEYDIAAMRGRDPENPSDRKSGNQNLEQTLEIREDGCTNTLTAVQKDNMVLETVGYLGDKRRQSTAVYSEEGVANTLSTAHGSGNGYILVKQATKEGTIKCDIGGGGRFELSRFSDTQRKSSRERTDKSNADNGEYP